MEITVSINDIDRTHQIGKKVAGKTRPTIVKLARYNMRSKIFINKKRLKGKKIIFKYCMFLQPLHANGNAPLRFINVLIFEFLLNLLFSVLLFFSQQYFYDFITDYFFKTIIVNYLSIMIAKENNEQQ